MNIFEYIIIFLFGISLGSFLNVVVLRFDNLKSILTERSHCPKCRTKLIWYDLVPLLSYVTLWGRCRKCKEPISPQYPLVELGTGLLLVALWWKFGFTVLFFVLSFISLFLIVIFVYDILKLQVANWLTYSALGVWVVWVTVSNSVAALQNYSIIDLILGGVFFGGFIWMLYFFSKEKWMGAGDVALGLLVGLIVGWPNVLAAAFLAFFIGAAAGGLLMISKKKGWQTQVPFAPFLILGLWITLLFGQNIVGWYMGLIKF